MAWVEAGRAVSFALPQGRTLAPVAESGSGKTVMPKPFTAFCRQRPVVGARTEAFADAAGSAPFALLGLNPKGEGRRKLLGERMSIVHKEPLTAVSVLHSMGHQVGEALYRRIGRAEARGRTLGMLAHVGIPDPEPAFRSYSFELSGALRQRAMVAMDCSAVRHYGSRTC